MSEWAYVAMAYVVVWGSLAVYALLLARRVARAQPDSAIGLEAPKDPSCGDVPSR